MFNWEAANTNFIVFGFTGLGLQPTIYHTHGEHIYHYTGAPTHDLSHSRWAHIPLYWGSNTQSITLKVSTHTIILGLQPTIYHTQGEHIYHYTGIPTHNLPHSRWAHIPLYWGSTHDLSHSRWAHLPLYWDSNPRSTTLKVSTLTTILGLHPTIYHTHGEHTYYYTREVVIKHAKGYNSGTIKAIKTNFEFT